MKNRQLAQPLKPSYFAAYKVFRVFLNQWVQGETFLPLFFMNKDESEYSMFMHIHQGHFRTIQTWLDGLFISMN